MRFLKYSTIYHIFLCICFLKMLRSLMNRSFIFLGFFFVAIHYSIFNMTRSAFGSQKKKVRIQKWNRMKVMLLISKAFSVCLNSVAFYLCLQVSVIFFLIFKSLMDILFYKVDEKFLCNMKVYSEILFMISFHIIKIEVSDLRIILAFSEWETLFLEP